MTRKVVSVGELATLAEIAELMETRRIKRVPVVHDGKIVGIVSRADLLQVLASGGATAADEDNDRQIRERLLAELRKQEWANPTESNVVVSDRVVHFWGTVGPEEESHADRSMKKSYPGDIRGSLRRHAHLARHSDRDLFGSDAFAARPRLWGTRRAGPLRTVAAARAMCR